MPGLIAHEWIAKTGGSEQVVKAMLEEFDDADVFCLWNDDPNFMIGREIKESLLARTPFRKSKALALPLMPAVWASRELKEYDWVLASSHLYAHQIGGRRSKAETPVFAYVHSPARYLWEPSLDGRAGSVFGRAVSPLLRWQDRAVAARGSNIAANSAFVQKRVERAWNQPSRVIYPPVDTDTIQDVESWSNALTPLEEVILGKLPDTFILGASRFVPYKRLDRVIDVGEASGIPVVLAGAGPDKQTLQLKARDVSIPVVFIDRPSNAMLFALYSKALVYVFPPIEDFGIMPVEAMALGTPVLVNATGGSAESAEALGGGVFLPDDSRAYGEALNRALALNMRPVIQSVRTLSVQSFRRRVREWIEEGI